MSMYGKKRDVVICPGKSIVKQSFKDQCDINKIVANYNKNGMITHLNGKVPVFMDVSNVKDYQSALALVDDAKDKFNKMTSAVRNRFHNNPGELIAFLDNPNNDAEAIELGLRPKKEIKKEEKDVKIEDVKEDKK